MKNYTSLVLDTLFRLVLLIGCAFVAIQAGGDHLSLNVILAVVCIIFAQGCSNLISAIGDERKAYAKA
jgi:hypothetical protein